jgi:hypothetical protein
LNDLCFIYNVLEAEFSKFSFSPCVQVDMLDSKIVAARDNRITKKNNLKTLDWNLNKTNVSRERERIQCFSLETLNKTKTTIS